MLTAVMLSRANLKDYKERGGHVDQILRGDDIMAKGPPPRFFLICN